MALHREDLVTEVHKGLPVGKLKAYGMSRIQREMLCALARGTRGGHYLMDTGSWLHWLAKNELIVHGYISTSDQLVFTLTVSGWIRAMEILNENELR